MFKKLTLTAAAIAATATAVAADANYIDAFAKEQNRDTQVELELVRSEGAGTLSIYSFHKGVQGNLLGSEMVHAGANADVRVDISRPLTDAIAVLTVNGVVVDTQEIDFN